MLDRVRIESVRNIEAANLQLDGQCCVFVGGNGAGKTSVLEAIYLLARGRTFRGRKSGDLTTRGKEVLQVEGAVRTVPGSFGGRLGFVRDGPVSRRYWNGLGATSGDGLERRLPLRLIAEDAGRLLEWEPAVRRGFLDLNLFHVEPRGEALLQQFRRTLAQRNAWLKAGGWTKSPWDQPFLQAAMDLHEARVRLLGRLERGLQTVGRRFDFMEDARVVYRRGWREGVTLADALSADREGERLVGFTRVGPQRADFGVRKPESNVGWSRGQSKVVVCLMQMALERVQRECVGGGSIWLIDDLWSDLDSASAKAVLELALALGGQCLFTQVALGSERRLDLGAEFRQFHVKQGVIRPIS